MASAPVTISPHSSPRPSFEHKTIPDDATSAEVVASHTSPSTVLRMKRHCREKIEWGIAIGELSFF